MRQYHYAVALPVVVTQLDGTPAVDDETVEGGGADTFTTILPGGISTNGDCFLP